MGHNPGGKIALQLKHKMKIGEGVIFSGQVILPVCLTHLLGQSPNTKIKISMGITLSGHSNRT